jgi:preprotein translocase subunit SecD
MKRRLLTSLIGIVVVAIAALITNLSVGNKPLLGLDLQGGASVTLRPTYAQPDPAAFAEVAKLYRSRIQSFNIGEAEVLQQGDTIVVNLPGVKDQERALSLIGTTGKVTFRPVMARQGGFSGLTVPLTGASGVSGASGPLVTVPSAQPTTTAAVSSASTTVPATTAANGAERRPSQTPTSTTVAPSTTTAGAATTSATPTTAAGPTTTVSAQQAQASAEALLTPGDKDLPTATVFLPDRNGTTLYELGPVFAQGEQAVDTAAAQVNQEDGSWQVSLTLKSGAGGLGAWNTAAAQCFQKASTCPDGGMAIIIDHRVISAPVPQQATFDTPQIRITGRFKQADATNLARVLKYGSTPVEMSVKASQTVSATLGKNSLRAGLVAGAIGIALVLILMLLYYRRLALVVLAGLCVSGSIIWSMVTMFNNFFVLTLAGVTGIIVSIGVTVDSYVVFFERLKDEVRSGRTLRNSAQRGFASAWRTILAADFVSLLGAVVLWYLSVGSVRGFALFLGLSTICDMVVAWFFTRPAVILLSRRKSFQNGTVLGMRTGEALASTGGDA